MANKLSYVIKFVADMDRAVAFYRDTLGLPLKFQSPGGRRGQRQQRKSAGLLAGEIIAAKRRKP